MSQFSRRLETIFCDDIRQEVGNKVSYMGVYSSELTVPTTPIVLPKLCVAIKAATEVKDPFQALDVHIVTVIGESETLLASTGMIPLVNEPSKEIDGSPLAAYQMMFVLSPFQIDAECIIRVKAITEREELRGIGLRIKVVQQPERLAAPVE